MVINFISNFYISNMAIFWVESFFPEFYLFQRNFTFVCCKENIIVDQFSTKEHSKRFVTLLQSGLKHLLSMEEENKTN